MVLLASAPVGHCMIICKLNNELSVPVSRDLVVWYLADT